MALCLFLSFSAFPIRLAFFWIHQEYHTSRTFGCHDILSIQKTNEQMMNSFSPQMIEKKQALNRGVDEALRHSRDALGADSRTDSLMNRMFNPSIVTSYIFTPLVMACLTTCLS